MSLPWNGRPTLAGAAAHIVERWLIDTATNPPFLMSEAEELAERLEAAIPALAAELELEEEAADA